MAKDLTTTKFEFIEPEGLALIMDAVTIVMTILSSVVVCLRFYVRLSVTAFSTEDWLMFAGWVSCDAVVNQPVFDGTPAAHLSCRYSISDTMRSSCISRAAESGLTMMLSPSA